MTLPFYTSHPERSRRVIVSLHYFTILILCGFTTFSFSQSDMRYVSYSEAPFSHWMLSSNYDTINGIWSHVSSLNEPLYGVTSFYLQDSGKVFVCGGADTLSLPQTSCSFFDPATNTYSQKAPLPIGRALGKLVRVRDSLYLVGSVGSSWNSPDGLIFKYDPHINSWTLKDTMPTPFLHESAVCVWGDSLIFTIGGSSNGFIAPTNIVRVYSPKTGRWRTISQGSFPVVVTTADAECLGNSIIVFGGYGTDYLNTVYKGNIDTLIGGILTVSWSLFDTTPFGTGVYRVGGGKWGDILLFGPAMRFQYTFNQLWGFRLSDSTWLRFTPNTLDSAGNRPTIAVNPLSGDSVYFYLFGGYAHPNIVASSEQYSFYPVPIGIISNNNQIPENYFLDQNYPNPFNPVTKIRFGIPSSPLSFGEGGRGVRLIVFDVLGRQIAVLVDQKLTPGTYEIEWNASNISSGIYFYTLDISGNILTRKMVIVK